MTNLANHTLDGSSARFELAQHIPGTTHDIYGIGGAQAHQVGSGVHAATLDLSVDTRIEDLLGMGLDPHTKPLIVHTFEPM
eukprot:7047772-Heterocapsa_arctica.AAC.1